MHRTSLDNPCSADHDQEKIATAADANINEVPFLETGIKDPD